VEKELRVTLSAIGMGHFVLDDGSMMVFPTSLQLPFDFQSTFADGTVQQILHVPGVRHELSSGGLAQIRHHASMSYPLKHHFIPAFFLAQWAEADEKLIEYPRQISCPSSAISRFAGAAAPAPRRSRLII